jgi:P-type E1-E2 ATPase
LQVFKAVGLEVCAVGDGANDELMIREAHCGLGIGVEPTAETRVFSDRQVTRSHFRSTFFAFLHFIRLKISAFWRHFYSISARACSATN